MSNISIQITHLKSIRGADTNNHKSYNSSLLRKTNNDEVKSPDIGTAMANITPETSQLHQRIKQGISQRNEHMAEKMKMNKRGGRDKG